MWFERSLRKEEENERNISFAVCSSLTVPNKLDGTHCRSSICPVIKEVKGEKFCLPLACACECTKKVRQGPTPEQIIRPPHLTDWELLEIKPPVAELFSVSVCVPVPITARSVYLWCRSATPLPSSAKKNPASI